MIKKVLFLSYIFLMATFFMPYQLNSAALILCGVISLTQLNKLPKKVLIISPIIFFFLLFLVLLLGMLNTSNTTHGWNIIERHYSLIFVPFIASSFTLLSAKQQKWVFYSFALSTTIIAVYLLGYAINDYFNTGSVYIENRSGHHIYNKFMHHRLTEPLSMHAVYFSLYLSFSFIFLLNNFIQSFRSSLTLIRVAYIFLFAFYALMIILLKSALFAVALPLAIIILLFLHFRNQIFAKTKYIIGTVSLIAILGTFSFYGLKSKLLNFSTDLDLTEQHPGSLKIRLGIWYSSWETIKDHWLFGVGTGDAHDSLIDKYHKLDFYIGKKDLFNTHNMYLEYWLSNGVFACLIYFFMLISFGLYFLRKKEYVGFIVIFLFASFSYTEATMIRQSGIVFFTLFSSLYIFNSDKIGDENPTYT